MTDNKMIILMRQESVLASWARDASTFCTSAGLIGLGVLVDSSPMQWMGFLFSIIFIFAKSNGLMKKHTFDIEGAKRRLAEIEAETTQ